MWVRGSVSVLGALACLLVASTSHAACTIDKDCEGDLICEAGQCVVAPPQALPAAPAPPPGATPAPATAPVVAQPAPAAAAEPIDEDPRVAKKRKLGKRHSRGMMITGIVMTSLSGLPLLFAAAGMISGQQEIMFGGLAIGGALAGVGIPLMVIGGRREPQQPAPTTATIGPWLTPQGGGLRLRFEL